MVNEKINESAREELALERKKYGFNPALGEDDSEDLDRGDIDAIEESDKEEVEDKEIESDKNSEKSKESEDSVEEEEEEENFDEEKDKVNPKRAKVFDVVKRQKQELKDAHDKIAELESKVPDDFQEELDKFTKEVGVEDPESLKKIIDFVKKFGVDKNYSKLQKDIEDLKTELQEAKESKPVKDEFPDEWKDFEKNVIAEQFPNATPEQIKSVQKKMEVLAKSKETGGKPYIDKETGKEVLDPYPLDYIFFKHKKDFEELVTTKKVRSMESARTAGINTKEKQDSTELEKPLPKNAGADAIRKMDQKYRSQENKMSGGLVGDGNNQI